MADDLQERIQKMAARVGATARTDLDNVSDEALDRLDDALIVVSYELDAMDAEMRREHGLPADHLPD